MNGHYFNEFDPGAAAWLRELMKAGLIPEGEVDERSITEVQADDLKGYGSCHFFGGIGGWPLALRLAGWDDARPVWTGSCPCPPFSSAGKKKACPECQSREVIPHPYQTGIFACVPCGHEWFADGRHLWPEFHRLIAECRPPVVFGEQVAGPDGVVWLAGVRATLERTGYAVGSADLAAGSVGAPHIRQRLFWVADAKSPEAGAGDDIRPRECDPRCGCGTCRLGHPDGAGPFAGRAPTPADRHGRPALPDGSAGVAQGDTSVSGLPAPEPQDLCGAGRRGEGRAAAEPGGPPGFWSAHDLIPCRDGKARRVEPGSFPLAHGVSGRVGLLRGYGNSICPQVAAEFVRAWEEATR